MRTRSVVRGAWCVGAALLVLTAVVLAGGCATNDKEINRDRQEDARQGALAPMPRAMANLSAMANAQTAEGPNFVLLPVRTNHLRFWWDGQLSTNALGVSVLLAGWNKLATQYWTIQGCGDLWGGKWVDLVTTNRMPALLDSTNRYAFYRSRMDIR